MNNIQSYIKDNILTFPDKIINDYETWAVVEEEGYQFDPKNYLYNYINDLNLKKI